MSHPLHGVHGRHADDSTITGAVVHIDAGDPVHHPMIYILRDFSADGEPALAEVSMEKFIPTDPAALRAGLAPRDHIAEAAALGTAIAARLLDGSRLSHVLGDVARSAVYAALGEFPPTKLGELAGRIGDSIAATALGSHAVDRRGLLLTMADRIGKAVRS